MGSRFVQVDLDFVDSMACGLLAARLGTDRDHAAGKMLRVWGWAVEQAIKAPENDPIRVGIVVGDEAEMLICDAARWAGSAVQFVEALERAGLAERSKKGVRFKGWEERYGAMLKKLLRDAKKPRGNLDPSRAGPERDGGGTGEGFARVDRRDQIVDPDRRDRSIDRPSDDHDQPNAPAIAFFERMQKRRAEVFPNAIAQQLLRDVGAKHKDEALIWAARYGQLLEVVGGNEERLWRAYEVFLADEWARGCPEPCPWQAFAKAEIFRRCVRDQGDGATNPDGTPGVRYLKVIPYKKGEAKG